MAQEFSVEYKDEVAKIVLAGRLDASNSGLLQEELKKLVGLSVKNLVFFAKDLEYISSAGLRVIIFAKQKIGVDAQVYMIAAQEAVLNIVKMSGLDNFMNIQESYNG